MLDTTVTFRALAGVFLIVFGGISVAQEGWSEFKVGDSVAVHRNTRKALEGEIVEIDETHLRLGTKLGKVSIKREDVSRLAIPKSANPDGETNGNGDVPVKAVPIQVEYGAKQEITLVVGSKLDLRVRNKRKKGCILQGADEADLIVTRMKMEFRYPLADIERIDVVSLPIGADEMAADEDLPPEVPEADEWPPGNETRVKVLLEGEKEWIFGAVLSVDEENETFELEAGALGQLTIVKKDIVSWITLGTSAGYLQLARLIRHYGCEINPDWAAKFLPKPGISRARDDEQLLEKIRVKPSPRFRIDTLPVNGVGAKPAKFERARMREYIDFQRSRYLALADEQIDYFYRLRLFDDEKAVKKVFRELKREKPGKEVEADTSRIGTEISRRLQVMSAAIKALESTLASAEEIQEAKDELAKNRDMARRFTDSIKFFEMFRKLSFATDEQLDQALQKQWVGTNKYVRDLMGRKASPLSDKVEAYDMPRPTTLVLDLSAAGVNALARDLTTLYAGAKTVPYDGDEWLFNRALRGITAGIMPPRQGYRFQIGSSGTDTGYAPVYHLVVYRYEEEEICRLAIFRVEPQLHVRILHHKGRMLLSEAEEWTF